MELNSIGFLNQFIIAIENKDWEKFCEVEKTFLDSKCHAELEKVAREEDPLYGSGYGTFWIEQIVPAYAGTESYSWLVNKLLMRSQATYK